MSVFDDPFSVAGLPAVDGPTGLRDDAAEPSRDVTGTDGGEIDELAAQSVSDIEEFWESAYGDDVRRRRSRPSRSWSRGTPTDSTVQFCGNDTYGLVNAGFCVRDNTIGWDRGELLPSAASANGDMAVTMVLAHEYGHAVQKQAEAGRRRAPRRWSPNSRPTAWPASTCAGSPRATPLGSR